MGKIVFEKKIMLLRRVEFVATETAAFHSFSREVEKDETDLQTQHEKGHEEKNVTAC